MAVDRIPNEISSEADVSMVLNTLMYVNDFQVDKDDLQDSSEQKTLCGLLDDMGKHYGSYSDEQKASYDSVYQYVYGKKPEIDDERVVNTSYSSNGHPDVGALVYHSHSVNERGIQDGAVGAAFYSVDSSGNTKDVYVAFRGTGDGRWYDNGDAFAKKYSPYQQDAAEYFDSVMEELPLSDQTNVYVTGHSKGGNQAQFVTLASKYGYLVDKCISMDGEGFSPEAIVYFKKIYGEEVYEEQLQKMYAICGDNDYVNVLGIKVIPEDHTVYVKSPTDVSDLANGHGLVNTKTGTGNLFNFETGSFYEQTSSQRELAIVAKALSENIMSLSREEREDVCRSLMSILEYGFNSQNELTHGIGLNGEIATTEEFLGFIRYGDDIFSEILYTWDGQKFINRSIYDALKTYAFQIEKGEKAPVFVDIVCNIGAFAIQVGVEPLLIKIDGFIKIISGSADLAEALAPVIEFCGNVLNSIDKFLKETFDQNYRDAQNYLANSSLIQLNTGDLWDLAEKLWGINGRLQTLDGRIDSLYWKVKWTDLWNLLNSDLKIGWSDKLNNCANCLSDTANRFDSIEQQIINMMG